MKKIIKKIIFITIFIYTLFFTKINAYAATADISISSSSYDIKVSEEITVTIVVSELDGKLGSWKYEVSHDSSKLSLISGEANVVDNGDGEISSKTYTLKYKAINSGSANINIMNASVADWNNEQLLEVNNPSININIKENIITGWKVENNNTYYYDSTGKKVKGLQEIDGSLYFFGENSYKLYKNGLITSSITGKTYYCMEDGKLKTGLHTINGETYGFAKTGERVKGLQEIDGSLYFFGENSYKMYKNGLITSSITGKTYYCMEDGKLKTGLHTINGQTYGFAKTGERVKGLQEIDGSLYFFGENSYKMYKNGLITSSITGKTYYCMEDGKLKTGLHTINGETYGFAKTGERVKGLQEIEGNLYFFGENSYKMYKDGFITSSITKKTYYLDSEGKALKGLQEINNNIYFFDESTSAMYKSSFATSSQTGETYYLNSKGVAVNGSQIINGNIYFFGENSYKMYKNGFITSEQTGSTYYLDSEGKALRGIQEIEGNIYFFGENSCKMYKDGFITSEQTGKTYYLDSEGKALKGLQKIDKITYFFDETKAEMYKSSFATSIQTGSTYYADSKGKIVSGIQTIKGDLYFFGENSYKMYKDGFITSEQTGSTYYLNNEGKALKGLNKINDTTYFFGEYTAKLLKKQFITSLSGKIYYTNENGVIQTGYQSIDGVDYLFAEDGTLKTGYQTINDKTYYFFLDGSLAKGVQKIQGERCYFDFTTGELLKRNVKSIIDVSYAQGYINWDQLWESGKIDGAILRIGYGTSRTDNPVEDTYFSYNLNAVKRLNIPYSIYIYGYAQTTEAAEKEATFVSDTLKKYGNSNLSFPIFYDAEVSYWNGVDYTANIYENTITSFSNKLNNFGYKHIGVYGSYNWFVQNNGRLNSPIIKQYPLWVAQYYNKCSYPNPYGWQYTSSGSLPGINTRVDMNIFF